MKPIPCIFGAALTCCQLATPARGAAQPTSQAAETSDVPAPAPAAAPLPGASAPPAPPVAAPASGLSVEAEGRVRVAGPLGDPRHRSPGLAAALSLNPFPVDLGNLYAENVGWGVAYTAAEVAVAGAAVWLMWEHMGCPCHGGMAESHSWSSRQMMAAGSLAAGYVGLKLVAALHAGRSAERFNARQQSIVWVVPLPGGAGAALGARF